MYAFLNRIAADVKKKTGGAGVLSAPQMASFVLTMGESFHRNPHVLYSDLQEGSSDPPRPAQTGHPCFEEDLMANVFIFPADHPPTEARCSAARPEGFELQALLPLIQEKRQIEDLGRIYPDGKCYPWGVPESGENVANWNLMAKDDLVLGYRNRAIVSASYVWMKIRNPALAARLWNEGRDGSLSLICFTDEPQWGETPIVPQMLGYLDRDCRGFTKLASEKCENILNSYGSFETFVRLCLRFDFPFSFRHSE
jgi:hypothetical protein